ncbi:MAG: hypothetical protein WA741_25060 [Candidatus Sulfotelmatobacter sp.]
MDVLLKEAGCCNTKFTGKAGTETAASLVSTIPNYKSMRQARHGKGGLNQPAAILQRCCYTEFRMDRTGHMRVTAVVSRTLWVMAAIALAPMLWAQSAQPPEVPAADLVRSTVANEVAAASNIKTKHMFRSRRETPRGSQTRLYVETNQALAAMTIASDDRALTPEEEQKEIGHLTWLTNNPDQLRKKSAREKEDEERSLRIVKALPDAFRYEYAGKGNSEPSMGKPGDELVRLTFKPNPGYVPPSRVEEVLGGMQGELLIDTDAHRLARIDGTLFREVTFGWGIIGHLNKGGYFLVKQADLGLGDGAWGLTEISLNITGKILLFKGLSMVSDEKLSDFRSVPSDLTFSQAVNLLKTEQENLAHSVHTPENPDSQKTPQ